MNDIEVLRCALQDGVPDEIRHKRHHGIFVGMKRRRDALAALDYLEADYNQARKSLESIASYPQGSTVAYEARYLASIARRTLESIDTGGERE